MKLIEHAQFDTVYHEHFSYLSLFTVRRIFSITGLRVWNVEQISTHGGSLRIYGCHEDDPRETNKAVNELIDEEMELGLQRMATYENFQIRANKIKDNLIHFLVEMKRLNKKVVAYGAAAKGNTLLNYAGIKPDLLPYVCDAALSKQGKFMPGSHIPILDPIALRDLKPEYVLILPWNISSEITRENKFITEWGGKFVVTVPEIKELI